MSDFISDIFDYFSSMLSDAWEIFEDVVETLWKQVIAPVIEEFMNLLGFEDETIVNGFLVTNQIYQDPWASPFKQAVISFVKNGTTMSDEVKNVYLTGNQVRIKAYMHYGENFYYYGLPTAGFNMLPSKPVDIRSIIQNEVGFPIVVISLKMTGSTVAHHCRQWLQDNESTHGYTWMPGIDHLVTSDGIHYSIKTFSYDVSANAFDIDVSSSPHQGGDISAAINGQNASTDVLDRDFGIHSAVNELLSLTPTYDSDDTGNPIFVVIDTAVHGATPAVTGVSGVTVAPADHGTIPSVTGFVQLDQTSTFLTLQDVIPSQPTGRMYEVQYQPTSNAVPDNILFWSYVLHSNDVTYPQLYSYIPEVTPDLDIFVPVAPLNLVAVYQNPPTNPVAKGLTTKTLLKKLNIKMDSIVKGLQDTELDQGNTIRDAFIVLGVNIATQNSQAVLHYLYDYFIGVLGNAPNYYDEWVVYKGYSNKLVNGDEDDQDDILDIFIPNWKTTRMSWWLLEPTSPYYDRAAWQEDRLELIAEVLANIYSYQASIKLKMSVVEDRYNFNLSIGAVTQELITGSIGLEGTYGKEIGTVDNNFFRIKHQVNPTQYNQLTCYEVSGFTAIKATGNTTTIARLDFVGSDNGGENVKNNFVIPMSYGVLKTRGAIEIKQLVYEGVHTVIHMQNVTELRYYETESFLRFIEVVVKVIAVVYLFYSWGEVTGAEFLWALATNIAAGVAIEYILTQIILHNPDNEAAVFVAVALATVAGAYLGTGVETAIDAALLGINAVSQVSTIYVEIKGDIIANNQSEFLQESAAKQEELDARFEEFHGNDNLLNFIKQTVISRVEPPDDFYARTLKSGVRDEMLDLAGRLDMENFFNKSVVIENTREG